MTGQEWAVAALVLLAAGAVLAPRPAVGRGRRLAMLGRLGHHDAPGRAGSPRPTRVSALAPTLARLVVGLPVGRLRWGSAAVGAIVGVLAAVLVGPVAGGVGAAYAGGAAFAAARALRRGVGRQALRRAVDAVGMLAADLRAGLPAPAALEASRADVAPVSEVADRVGAAVAVADRTGAPLADVLDRLDADLRAGIRLRTAVAAQAAGARASAWLLAVLPVAGVALGPAIGADTARVLLHTPLGAACVCAGVALQIGGLAWSARLARVAP